MRRINLKSGYVFLATWLLLAHGCLSVHARAADFRALAKEFTAKCLVDKNVFVYNPPADQNPYREMSKEELEKFRERIARDGSILFLYLDGLPAQFVSHLDFKEHDLQQTWYPDGRTRSVEHYDHGKLLNGAYYDGEGTVLSRIEQGAGRKTIFREPMQKVPEPVHGSVDYVHGVKDGVEVLYSDYAKQAKSAESHYREGNLDGPRTQWLPTGEKNSEKFYRKGRLHGSSTYWYKNGQIQSAGEHVEGTQVGRWTRYYETGVKAQERFSDEAAEWYPSGQLMTRKTFGDGGGVISGNSFDSLGNQTGRVVEGSGSLIEGEEVERHGHYRLLLFKEGRPDPSILLPRPTVSFDYKGVDQRLRFALEALDKDIEGLRLSLLLPPNYRSQDKLTVEVDRLRAGSTAQVGPVGITPPEPVNTRNGALVVDVQGMIAGNPVRYQHDLSEHLFGVRQVSEPPREITKPRPRRELPWYINNKRPSPVIDGTELPPSEQAADSWRLGDNAWVLYNSPALLVVSKDHGRSWQAVRKDFSYRPSGLHVRAEDDVIIWGAKPTADVSQGIPHVVERSRDGCASWSPLKIPQVDFLLGIDWREEVLFVSAIRIPKGGIPSGTDWFELPHTVLLSRDGESFTEVVGPSFFGTERIKAKSIAPNEESRAFLSVSSWLDTSYGLYLAKRRDDVPIQRLHPSAAGEIVWSANSRILALRCAGNFIAYVDVATGEIGQVSYAYMNGAGEKQKAELLALDAKVRQLLEANAE